jgi:hypothetical protein
MNIQKDLPGSGCAKEAYISKEKYKKYNNIVYGT